MKTCQQLQNQSRVIDTLGQTSEYESAGCTGAASGVRVAMFWSLAYGKSEAAQPVFFSRGFLSKRATSLSSKTKPHMYDILRII